LILNEFYAINPCPKERFSALRQQPEKSSIITRASRSKIGLTRGRLAGAQPVFPSIIAR
jgi:hypothetical protein